MRDQNNDDIGSVVAGVIVSDSDSSSVRGGSSHDVWEGRFQ